MREFLKKRELDYAEEYLQDIMTMVKEEAPEYFEDANRVLDYFIPLAYQWLVDYYSLEGMTFPKEREEDLADMIGNRLNANATDNVPLWETGRYVRENKINLASFTNLQSWFDVEAKVFKQIEQRKFKEKFKEDDAEKVYEFKDGWSIVELKTKDQCELEGQAMDNCTWTIHGPSILKGTKHFYSLRDEDNFPHATIFMNYDGSVVEVRGQAQSVPGGSISFPQLPDQYTNRVAEWLGKDPQELTIENWKNHKVNPEKIWDEAASKLKNITLMPPANFGEIEMLAQGQLDQFLEDTQDNVEIYNIQMELMNNFDNANIFQIREFVKEHLGITDEAATIQNLLYRTNLYKLVQETIQIQERFKIHPAQIVAEIWSQLNSYLQRGIFTQEQINKGLEGAEYLTAQRDYADQYQALTPQNFSTEHPWANLTQETKEWQW